MDNHKSEKNITIDDIARIANVSKATVSRCLNNNGSISKSTRAKILQIASELNFRFNVHAQNLAKSKSDRIGIVFPNNYLTSSSLEFFSSLEASLVNVIDEMFYDIALLRVKDIKKALESKLVSGLIIVTRDVDSDYLELLKRHKISFVFLSLANKDILGKYDMFASDNTQSAYDITKHLIDNGAKKILTITSNNEIYTDYIFRTIGYKKAMEENNLSYSKEDIIYTDITFENAKILVKEKIDFLKGYDAIFTQQDQMALGLINNLKQNGILPPRDILIAGHDDEKIIKYFEPQLTSYKQSYSEISRHAMNRLLVKIKNKEEDKNLIDKKVAGKIIVRESSVNNFTF